MPRFDHLTDPTLRDFTELRAGRTRMLVRRGYGQHAHLLGLRGDPGATGGSVSGGRAEHPLVELPRGEHALVRRYLRGGAMRRVNRSRYFAGRRAYHELLVTERARAAGVSVPVILAAAERRGILGYSAWLASRWIPDALDLAAWLGPGVRERGGCPEAGDRAAEERPAIGEAADREAADPATEERPAVREADREAAGPATEERPAVRGAAEPDAAARETVMEMVGREVGAMHRAGIAHPDLNLRNVLVARAGAAAPAVYLLDFDRGRLYPGPVPERRRRRELERFARSVRKLAAPVTPEDWNAFHAGYASEWPHGAQSVAAL
jgi:3-deoxy-D-manno-octulosonic acid kinase